MGKSSDVAIISLGSNLGNRSEHMERMLCFVRKILESPLRHSPVMETAPVDVENEIPPFLNCIVSGVYNGTPHELLNACMEIERRCGRKRGPGIVSRCADVDILLLGSQVVHETELEIPHPAIPRRRFCIEGVAAIAPEFVHPEQNAPFSAILRSMSEVVRAQPVHTIKESDYPRLVSCLLKFE